MFNFRFYHHWCSEFEGLGLVEIQHQTSTREVYVLTLVRVRFDLKKRVRFGLGTFWLVTVEIALSLNGPCAQETMASAILHSKKRRITSPPWAQISPSFLSFLLLPVLASWQSRRCKLMTCQWSKTDFTIASSTLYFLTVYGQVGPWSSRTRFETQTAY